MEASDGRSAGRLAARRQVDHAVAHRCQHLRPGFDCVPVKASHSENMSAIDYEMELVAGV